jgi:hypothetical protein
MRDAQRHQRSARAKVRWTPALVRLLLGATLWVAYAQPDTARAEELRKTGTIRIQQTQIAFIGSGNLGGGTLSFAGRSYGFRIGGLGVGGIGLSKITATGAVYNLNDLAYFPGAYIQGRYGAVVGEKSRGKLWLTNSNGVVLELEAERKGLALSLGGDAVYIDLK